MSPNRRTSSADPDTIVEIHVTDLEDREPDQLEGLVAAAEVCPEGRSTVCDVPTCSAARILLITGYDASQLGGRSGPVAGGQGVGDGVDVRDDQVGRVVRTGRTLDQVRTTGAGGDDPAGLSGTGTESRRRCPRAAPWPRRTVRRSHRTGRRQRSTPWKPARTHRPCRW